MRIRIQKIGAVPTGYPPNPKENHVDGQDQGEKFSLPIDYTIEGDLPGEIEVGKSVRVDRDTRNGVKAPGLFATSPVTKVTKTQFKTLNSVYNYEFLK